MPVDSKAAVELKRLRERAGLSVRALAEAIGIKPSSSYAYYEDEYKKPILPVDLVQKLVQVLPGRGDVTEGEVWALSGVTPTTIAVLQPKPTAPKAIAADLEFVPDFVGVAEIDVIGGLGAGGQAGLRPFWTGEDTIPADAVRDVWSLPPSYVAGELRITSKRARIIEVRGDSMEPTLYSGDRVMIDVGDRSLSQEGIFALWDGDGVAVKRLEKVRPSDPPTIRLISDNPRHRDAELTADAVSVIGRVIWVARKM